MSKNDYYFAYDPILDRRVMYVKRGDTYISLLTGHKFTEEDVKLEAVK